MIVHLFAVLIHIIVLNWSVCVVFKQVVIVRDDMQVVRDLCFLPCYSVFWQHVRYVS